jgi:hypothetical protein
MPFDCSLRLFCAPVCIRHLPQGTAFTYQGRLNDGGSAANGSYDLTFTLYATSSGGSAMAGPLTNSTVGVSNGLFIATLDFGGSVFNGNPYWLGIGVRTNGGGVFTTLSPRQQLTPTPYAIFASTAGQLTGNALQQVDNQALIVVNSTVNTATNNLLLTANAGILSATNNFMVTATNIASALTNGLVTSTITNGLASTNFVNTAVLNATNNALTLASNSFYGVGNVSGFQTAAQVQTATNNLLTTVNSGILSATNNFMVAATNIANASALAATNAGNIVFTNTTLFDTNGAAIAAAQVVTNNFGTTVPVNLTNATNQFVGSFTGNGGGLTNVGGVTLATSTTNAFYLSGAGSAVNGTFWNWGDGGTSFTNFFNPKVVIVFSSPVWLLESNGTAFYQTTTLIGGTWTRINGDNPVPSPIGQWGFFLNGNGGVWYGLLSSTNMTAQINSAVQTATNNVMGTVSNYVQVVTNTLVLTFNNNCVFNSNPNSENVVPPILSQPSFSYSTNNSYLPIYKWNIITHIWQ